MVFKLLERDYMEGDDEWEFSGHITASNLREAIEFVATSRPGNCEGYGISYKLKRDFSEEVA